MFELARNNLGDQNNKLFLRTKETGYIYQTSDNYQTIFLEDVFLLGKLGSLI